MKNLDWSKEKIVFSFAPDFPALVWIMNIMNTKKYQKCYKNIRNFLEDCLDF